jgi:hypothetical protein
LAAAGTDRIGGVGWEREVCGVLIADADIEFVRGLGGVFEAGSSWLIAMGIVSEEGTNQADGRQNVVEIYSRAGE